MTEKQNIAYPTIKTGLGYNSSPNYTLTFKNTESIEQWRKQLHAIPFAENHYLVEGYVCLCQIEQPEPSTDPAKPAPRVPGAVGKSQTFYTDSSGRITRPY